MYDLTHYCCKQVSSKNNLSAFVNTIIVQNFYSFLVTINFYIIYYNTEFVKLPLLENIIRLMAWYIMLTLKKLLIYLLLVLFLNNKVTPVCPNLWNSCNIPTVTKYIFVFLNEDHHTLKRAFTVIFHSCHNHIHNIEMRWNRHLPFVIMPSCYDTSHSMHLQLFI